MPNINNDREIEIEPATPAKKSIIWLHGLGADGNDFVPAIPVLQLPDALSIRFVFPHAPIRPISINNNMEMRAWFNIHSASRADLVDSNEIKHSQTIVDNLIKREIDRGITTKNIILAGFSQGAVMALISGLSYSSSLGGIIALSGYLPSGEILNQASIANKKIPIFMAHGLLDPIIPYVLGKATCQILTNAHYAVSWHEYPMPHSVCTDEILDISQWIQKIWKQT